MTDHSVPKFSFGEYKIEGEFLENSCRIPIARSDGSKNQERF